MNIWKEYSISYIKNNRATSISILIAAFIASLLLSLTCGVFYNIWADEVRLIKLKEGNWHAKLSGTFTEETLHTIESHPNIKKVTLEAANDNYPMTAAIHLYHPRSIYKDVPKLVERLSSSSDNSSITVQYHNKLLSQYFIFSKAYGNEPPLILLIYLFTLLFSCFVLVLIIHNAFGISMNARLHQLGILQSIGATPKQLRNVLTTEAVVLSLPSVIVGVSIGAGLCYIFMRFVKSVTTTVREYELVFQYHPAVIATALLISLVTVWYSARIPARRICRYTPLEALRNGKELQISKMRRFSILSHLFGIEGELARKSLYARRRAFRTSTLSLTLSFLVFSAFLNLETISRLSTKYTYFERYHDKWDLMLSITDTGDQKDAFLTSIRDIPGVKSCISYRKETAYTYLTKDQFSNELLDTGALKQPKALNIKVEDGRYRIEVPTLILDEKSFYEYSSKVQADTNSVSTTEPGVIVVNTIWDFINSNRRHRIMLPYLKSEGNDNLVLWTENEVDGKRSDVFQVTLAAETDQMPKLKEEFPNFSLLQIMSESTYEALKEYFNPTIRYYNIMVNSEQDISAIELALEGLIGSEYEYDIDNRIEDEENNVKFRNAYKLVIGGLMGLFVCIGLANVFSNALGHIQQRKREFARYLSVGLAPPGIKKVLFLEALILGSKPILISMLINIPLIAMALNESLITPKEFTQQIPALPIFIFAVIILLSVGFANYLGARRIYQSNLIEALKDDTLV